MKERRIVLWQPHHVWMMDLDDARMREQLLDTQRNNTLGYSCFAGKKLIGMGGITHKTDLVLWFWAAQELRDTPLYLQRNAKKYLGKLIADLQPEKLTATVIDGHKAAEKWAGFFGFKRWGIFLFDDVKKGGIVFYERLFDGEEFAMKKVI